MLRRFGPDPFNPPPPLLSVQCLSSMLQRFGNLLLAR